MRDEAGQQQNVERACAMDLECEMNAVAGDIVRRRRIVGSQSRAQQRQSLWLRRHTELVAQPHCEGVELPLGRAAVSGQHQVADQSAAIHLAQRVERDQAGGMGCGRSVIAGGVLVLHHAFQRLDGPAAQGFAPKESPFVELRATVRREAGEKFVGLETAGELERAAIAGRLEQRRIHLQIHRWRPADRRPVDAQAVIAERQLNAVQQPSQPPARNAFGAVWPEHRRGDLACDRALGLSQVDEQCEPLAQRQAARLAVAPDLRIAKCPDAEPRHLDATCWMRPAMTASGDARGTVAC